MSGVSLVTEPVQRGAIVYNREGHEARYLAQLPNGSHAVRPGVTCYSADPDVGDHTEYQGIAEWAEIFTRPPVEKLNAEVAALNAQIEALHKEHQAVRLEHMELNREIAARKDRLKQHAQLAQLDDYLAGKITHFVVLNRGYSEENPPTITVETFKEALEKEDRWSRGRLKLLTLFGDSKGDLSWGLQDYTTDCGNQRYRVIPCASAEQAQSIAVAAYEEELAAWRTDQQRPKDQKAARRVWSPQSVIGHAMKLGLPVPQDAVAANEAEKLAEAQENVKSARNALKKAEAELFARQMRQAIDSPSTPRPPSRA